MGEPLADLSPDRLRFVVPLRFRSAPCRMEGQAGASSRQAGNHRS